MKISVYLDPQRREKAGPLVRAFAAGCRARIITTMRFDRGAQAHAFVGNWLSSQLCIPRCREERLPYWYMDSAFIHPVSREPRYYRLTANGLAPDLSQDRTMDRAWQLGVRLKPWRQTGKHVVLLAQGPSFGKPWGLDARGWLTKVRHILKRVTDRPVRIREKIARESKPLSEDLRDAWAVVTHSSTAAVEAAIAGIPVFCAPTCPAAVVGSLDVWQIEDPPMPDREPWIAGLAWCQWTLDEYRRGAWLG